MVKFGRHFQFVLECEESDSHYIVPYIELRDQICNYSTADDTRLFEREWRESLRLASDDFHQSTSSCWNTVFESISRISRGVALDSALKLYSSTCGITASQDLLCFLKNIHSAANLNSEGLRKLVKKFDKLSPSSSLSSILLPELYSCNFFIGIQSLHLMIETLRELLDDLNEIDDDSFNYTTGALMKFGKEKKFNESYNYSSYLMNKETYDPEEVIIGRRADEMLWLRNMLQQIPEEVIEHAVAHRGFHNPRDNSDKRPLENSLSAFEAAWTNGVHLCECDVALTKDEKLVLAHDSDFSRLSLDPTSDISNRKLSELTFRELLALTLKNGVRAPLLLEVLHSAKNIGPRAQLVIEIKPGNNQAAMALARLFRRHPEFVPHVAAIMSFDLWAMHALREALSSTLQSGDQRKIDSLAPSPSPCSGKIGDAEFSKFGMPKLMLLTVAHPPVDHYELWVDINDYGPIDGWLNTDVSILDGVYVRYESEMMDPNGTAELKKLCSKYVVGIWGMWGEDPDDYETMHYLVKECGVSFFNTDLPRKFLSKSCVCDNSAAFEKQDFKSMAA